MAHPVVQVIHECCDDGSHTVHTLPRRCSYVAQLSIRVCATTDRHESTTIDLSTSNTTSAFVMMFTQNRSGKLELKLHTIRGVHILHNAPWVALVEILLYCVILEGRGFLSNCYITHVGCDLCTRRITP